MLFVAPHPDDEIVSGYGLISAARSLGMDVRIMIVTDGTASHRNSVRFPQKRLRNVREKESVQGLRGLGIHKSKIWFSRLPDGGLDSCSEQRIQRDFVRPMMQTAASCDIVVGPAPQDAHPDHADVGRIMNDRLPQRKLRTYITWEKLTDSQQNIAAVPTRTNCKRAALKRYRTQCGLIDDDLLGFSFSTSQINRFCRPFELFECKL